MDNFIRPHGEFDSWHHREAFAHKSNAQMKRSRPPSDHGSIKGAWKPGGKPLAVYRRSSLYNKRKGGRVSDEKMLAVEIMPKVTFDFFSP